MKYTVINRKSTDTVAVVYGIGSVIYNKDSEVIDYEGIYIAPEHIEILKLVVDEVRTTDQEQTVVLLTEFEAKEKAELLGMDFDDNYLEDLAADGDMWAQEELRRTRRDR